MSKSALRVGIGGPVGSGKTALVRLVCLALRERYSIAVITNDIYTREDAEFSLKNEALEQDRILGVMDRDTTRIRGERPFAFTNLKSQKGLAKVIDFIENRGRLTRDTSA